MQPFRQPLALEQGQHAGDDGIDGAQDGNGDRVPRGIRAQGGEGGAKDHLGKVRDIEGPRQHEVLPPPLVLLLQDGTVHARRFPTAACCPPLAPLDIGGKFSPGCQIAVDAHGPPENDEAFIRVDPGVFTDGIGPLDICARPWESGIGWGGVVAGMSDDICARRRELRSGFVVACVSCGPIACRR